MRYVGDGVSEDGCVFCNRQGADDDTSSLILWRGERSFLIMNLYPYNSGHVMLVPNDHVESPETTDPATLAEMATLLPRLLRAERRTLACHGFNVGFNVGSVAGAGIAAHLHQHVVPRWAGDANFMPILASTMVLPELIPVTYGKLRAEVEREVGSEAIAVVILDRDGARYAARSDRSLPVVLGDDDRPLWRSAVALAGQHGGGDLLGWAGPMRAGAGRGALALRIEGDAPAGMTWLPAHDGDIEAVARALALIAPRK